MYMPEYQSLLRVIATAAIFLACQVIWLSNHVIFLSHHVTAFSRGACEDNPCMNGGQCVDMGTEENPKQFTCACSEGYTGLTCQKRIDPCGDEPCQNGGICEPRGEHFHCACSERFKGRLCEQYIRKRNPCLGDPCGSHGYCEVVNYDFICECSPGYHGSRCEFEEEPEEDKDEREEILVAAEEDSDSRKALVVVGVVLAILVIFGVILLLLSLHWMRVANKRSKHQAAQELKAAAGKEIEATPGWFETSNTLCYDFFCYCCKLVNKWENENKIIINCDDPNARECFERCCGGGGGGGGALADSFASALKKSTTEIGPPSRAISQHSGNAKVESAQVSKAPSRTGSKPPSRGSSRANQQTATELATTEEEDFQGNATANQLEQQDSECWACLPNLDRSHNRAMTSSQTRQAVPRYSVARHYPVMPSKYGGQGRYGPEIKMVDSRRAANGNVKKTARGVLPGFQPCSQYLLGESVGDVDTEQIAPMVPSKKVRVRRRAPMHGRSDRATIDIMECGADEVDEDDDDFDEEGSYDGGAMVGPKGNILPVPFRKEAVNMRRDAGHVDPMYFDDGHCSNQSNSFGTHNHEMPRSETGQNYSSAQETHAYGSRGRIPVYRNNHAADSDSDDCGGDSENDGAGEDGDENENGDAIEDGDDNDADGDDDDDEDDDNGFPLNPPPQRPPPRRRPRRFQGRRAHYPPDDDGYSSPGGMSESDAGGRSRDPLSMEATTRQARKNFFSRETRQLSYPPATATVNPRRPQGRVSRQELANHNAVRKIQQGGPGITLSPHSAAPGTPPVVYSNCPSPAQHRFEPLKTSSPCTVTPVDYCRATPPYHYQHQQHHHQTRNLPYANIQSYSNPPSYDQQGRENIDERERQNRTCGGPGSLRRPRHSLQGWDGSVQSGTPASPLPVPYAPAPSLSEYPAPPVRRQKVKGILKKTSAYGSSHSARGSEWTSGESQARSATMNGYGHPPKRPNRYPPAYSPPAFDQFVV